MDKWANLATYACLTCRFFVPKGELTVVGPDMKDHPMGVDKVVGRCRRHAPTMEGYPVVYAGDWCGDHKLGTNPSRELAK